MIHPLQLEMLSIQLALEKQKTAKLEAEIKTLKTALADLVDQILIHSETAKKITL